MRTSRQTWSQARSVIVCTLAISMQLLCATATFAQEAPRHNQGKRTNEFDVRILQQQPSLAHLSQTVVQLSYLLQW